MANITIGTTPTHTFTVDTDLRDAVEIMARYQILRCLLTKMSSTLISQKIRLCF